MDFDLSKENIQPLRQGRNAQQLELVLQAQTNPEYQMQLVQQKEHYEALIRNDKGDDPLQSYYEYISWIEQSYPKNGHEGNCINLLEHCLKKFEDDPRYANDRRFCKLWIKYIDMTSNPLELYSMLKAKNLCTGCADFYKAWAYYYEVANDFHKAYNIIEEGKKNLAQPYDDLEICQKNLITAAGEHKLFGPNVGQLEERRQALTSLHSYRSGRVNSVRTASVANNGVITIPNACKNTANAQVLVYEDQASASLMDGVAPLSIITVAKRQEAPKENILKPGPWTTVPHKKRVLGNQRRPEPKFIVHEDDDDEFPMGCLPPNLPPVTKEDYIGFHFAIINCMEEPNPNTIYGYPKHKVYAECKTEYSIEEIRALRYQKSNQSHEDAVQSILIDDDIDEDCIIVQDPLEPMNANFQIFEEPSIVRADVMVSEPAPQVYDVEATSSVTRGSPWKSQEEHQNFLQEFISKSHERRLSDSTGAVQPEHESPESNGPFPPFAIRFSQSPQRKTRGFAVYEDMSPQAPPRGNAMKTAFSMVNADEVETGSRGGMDSAMAAQPADTAKKPATLINFSDSSSSSYGDADVGDLLQSSCTTQQFNFDLNAMKVSTPQSKTQNLTPPNEEQLENSRKMLFTDYKSQARALSTILEEKSGYTSGSSSSGGTASKSLLINQQYRMSTISEEHNSYLEQNRKANEALRRSLLGNLMEDVMTPTVHIPPVTLPSSPMQSTPLQSPVRKIPPPNIAKPLDHTPSDPFNPRLIARLLDRVDFPGNHSQGYLQFDGSVRLTVKKEPVYIGRDSYLIEKILGKGQFGTVYKAHDYQTNTMVALKYQKPPNKWEFYICRELQARLKNHPLCDRFMDISVGYFTDQASVLVSRYEPFGSLLDAANLTKQLFSKGKETICIYFTLEMLKIVRAMHEAKIIHADIKPDNFLVLLLPDNTLGLQLIDFGCSIDMTLFPENAMFTRPINTEDFVCCEVRDGRPWSYHTDLFCVAASAHVLLFHEYIQLRKTRDVWNISMRLPRYTKIDLWNMFFNNLLNQQSGPADIATLNLLFQEELDDLSRQKDLYVNLNSLVNALKNR